MGIRYFFPVKVGFEEMEHAFPFGIFRPEKKDYPFRCSVVPGNFPLDRRKQSCSTLTFHQIFRKRSVNGKTTCV